MNLFLQFRFVPEPGWNTWTNPNIASIPPPLRPPNFVPGNSVNPTSSLWPPRHRLPHQSEMMFHTNSGSNSPSTNTEMAQHLEVPLDAAKRKTLPTWIR